MKVWVLAGLFTMATAPMAFAAEDATECQLDDMRRAAQQEQVAPASPNTARPTVAERQVVDQQPMPPRAVAAERRRNGKRIPDAQLIGPRGAL